MNTPQEPNTPAGGKSPEVRPQVDEQRRRLTKGGLAAPIVMGTLLSRPVLGAAPYHCTISGQISGNISPRPGAGENCKTLGRSPGYWKNHQTWPTPFAWGAPAQGECPGQNTTGTLFNGFTINGATLELAFKCKDGAVLDPMDTNFDTVTSAATMLQVLQVGGGSNDTGIKALGRATVASLLNARQFGTDYPLTPERVIQMFNAVYKGGTYQVNATTFWSRDQVKTYFESLYGAM